MQYLSLTKLYKLVDPDQLPEELGGHLPYQHKQWVKNRLVGAGVIGIRDLHALTTVYFCFMTFSEVGNFPTAESSHHDQYGGYSQ